MFTTSQCARCGATLTNGGCPNDVTQFYFTGWDGKTITFDHVNLLSDDQLKQLHEGSWTAQN